MASRADGWKGLLMGQELYYEYCYYYIMNIINIINFVHVYNYTTFEFCFKTYN